MTEITTESFLRDVANHEMTIKKDDGLYRHLVFKKPGTSDHQFEMVTWPGYLAYSGDMGEFMFQRLPDMFQFFRAGMPYNMCVAGLRINPGYWSEKCVAIDKSDGIEKYSPEVFKRIVNEWADETASEIQNNKIAADFLEAVYDNIIRHADDGEIEARLFVENFEFKHDGRTESISDFGEHDLTDYTFRFLWCCYAISWGIEQYDKLKAENADV